MLRTSPVLVTYAIFLLLTQYLCDLDFIDEELKKIDPNMTDDKYREQIGIPKSVFPVKELAIKVRYLVVHFRLSQNCEIRSGNYS